MNPLLKRLVRELRTLLTALFLAVVVWVIVVNTTDPVEKRVYSGSVKIDVVGLGQNLMLADPLPENINVILSAPKSVWNSALSGQKPVWGVLDLTNLTAGTYDVDLKILTRASPIRVDGFTPSVLTVTIQEIVQK